jgi:aminoglycoside phosphotransferase (APT) family kinase protein
MERIGTPGAGAWSEALAAAPALARRRLQTALRRAGWGDAPRSGWVAAIAPALAAAAQPVAGRERTAVASLAEDWFTETVAFTDTSVVVAVVGCRASGRRRVVKMPCTAEGAARLRRQADVLAALHADDRLTGWLDVVPRPYTDGEIAGRPYWVEDAVPGTPMARMPLRTAGDGQIFAAAIRLIEDLHARTADERTLDPADVALWVDRPLGILDHFYATSRHRGGCLAALSRLGARLSDELAGRRVRTSWIHGDFWPGNLLVTGSAVTGLVDWDCAGPHQLPLQDLLHLSFFVRRARQGCELGDVVVCSLQNGLEEATGVPARQLDVWLGGVPPAIAVLLFWLRYISLYIGSEGHGDNRYWLRRNVDSVLASC